VFKDRLCGVSTRAILKRLGDEIRQRRHERDLTQEALAHESGVHTNAVAKLERGKTDSRVLTLFKVAKGLNMPLSELISGAMKPR
jgi:transcriptional regulator with XRE-family HTH domain